MKNGSKPWTWIVSIGNRLGRKTTNGFETRDVSESVVSASEFNGLYTYL